ncbi:MAG: hypothetical protein QXE79_06685 [Candidatus Bathyarchaeia archaeon]
MDKRLYCVICGAEISYRFGRPRKVCGNPQGQKALQRLRVRRFKLRKKKVRGEALYSALRAVSTESYEPTIYSSDLGNILNIGEGSSLKVIPDYSGAVFQGYREPNTLTVEFIKDSIEFYRRHPSLIRHPGKLKPNPRVHRIGAGVSNIICGICGSSNLLWRSEGGWFCPECGNDIDFSLPIS